MPVDKTMGEQQESRRRRRRSETAVVASEAEAELQDDVAEARSLTEAKGRATPSRRRQEEPEEKGNLVTRVGRGLSEYFQGVRSELGKVAWPTREETRRLTQIVLVTLIISALILGAISLLFTELFRIGLATPAILLAAIFIPVAIGLVYARMSSRRSTTY